MNIFVIGLTLLSATPARAGTDIASITPALLESNVQVTGTVQSVQPAQPGRRGPSQFILRDSTGTLPVVFWAKTAEELQTIASLQPGDTVELAGKVGRFKGTLQLELQSLANLTVTTRASPPLPASPPTPLPASGPTTVIPLGAIKKHMVGETVTVVARIIHIRVPTIETAPYVITLAQEAATLPLVLWSDNYAKVKDHLQEGKTIRVTGLVNTHKGRLQIKLRHADDLRAE